MILVDLKDGQGLGNQLWLLAVGIYISNKKSRKLVIRNIQKFKADDLLTEKFFLYIELFSNYHLDIVWNVFNPLAFKYGFDENNIYFQEDKKFLDLFDMFEYIEIDGNYQSITLIPEPEILNKFFNFNKTKFKRIINYSNTCLINIRGGEYLGLLKSPCVSLKYIYGCIEIIKKKIPNIDFKIITDDYKFAKIILPEYEILYGNLEQDYLNLESANYLILSNSSFAFFPTYLSNNKKIILAPFMWAGSNNFNKNKIWLSPCNFNKIFSFVNEDGELINNYNYFKAVFDSSNKILPPSASMLFKRKFKFISENNRDIKVDIKSKFFYKIKRKILLLKWGLKKIKYLFFKKIYNFYY